MNDCTEHLYQNIRSILRPHTTINAEVTFQRATLYTYTLTNLKAEAIRHIHSIPVTTETDIINNLFRNTCWLAVCHNDASHANSRQQRMPLINQADEKVSWEEWFFNPLSLPTERFACLNSREEDFKPQLRDIVDSFLLMLWMTKSDGPHTTPKRFLTGGRNTPEVAKTEAAKLRPKTHFTPRFRL